MPDLFCNMSRLDRSLRGVFAVAFLVVVLFTDHMSDAPTLAVAGSVFAVVNLFAVGTGHCLMYRFTGTDTKASRV